MKLTILSLCFLQTSLFAMQPDRSGQGLFVLLPPEIQHIIADYLIEDLLVISKDQFTDHAQFVCARNKKMYLNGKEIVSINNFGSLEINNTSSFFSKKHTLLKSHTDQNGFLALFRKKKSGPSCQTDFFATSYDKKNIVSLVSNQEIHIYSLYTKKLLSIFSLKTYFDLYGKTPPAHDPATNFQYYGRGYFTYLYYDTYGRYSNYGFDASQSNTWFKPVRLLAITNDQDPTLAFANDQEVFIVKNVVTGAKSYHIIEKASLPAESAVKTIAFNKQATLLGIEYRNSANSLETGVLSVADKTMTLGDYFKKRGVRKNW